MDRPKVPAAAGATAAAEASLAAIGSRRSVREYGTTPVGPEARRALLRAGMAAPSAHGKKPWRFAEIGDPELRRRIVAAFPWFAAILAADYVVLVAAKPDECVQREYWPVDCAAAAENMLVAATAMGLGSLWMGIAPVEENVRRFRALVELPAGLAPFALLAFGQILAPPAPREPWDPALVVEAKAAAGTEG